jgi:trans-2,3-dihydro-3-hydroxyanthranilate isomerase
MRKLPYAVCDVFTDRPLAGNALGVFTDAEGLGTAEMQALAREMSLSECSFVLRPTTAEADARIRIFTPTMELPFAGHPTLGTAFVLSEPRALKLIRLETARGISGVRLEPESGSNQFGWMTQPIPVRRPFEPMAELLGALGVKASQLPIELYDNGPHYVYVALEHPEELVALRPDMARLAALGSTAFSVFAPDGARWKCRVFAPGEGIPEDPATGAAAGPLAIHLARYGRIRFGETIVIDQGAEIGRPSTLHARAMGDAEKLDAVEVGGSAVVVAHGMFSYSWSWPSSAKR